MRLRLALLYHSLLSYRQVSSQSHIHFEGKHEVCRKVGDSAWHHLYDVDSFWYFEREILVRRNDIRSFLCFLV